VEQLLTCPGLWTGTQVSQEALRRRCRAARSRDVGVGGRSQHQRRRWLQIPEWVKLMSNASILECAAVFVGLSLSTAVLSGSMSDGTIK
jgi:hypothetical protein